jgi:riboflavin kinase / FMN adenylyltransferase
MEVFTDLAAVPRRPRAVAIGTFDGVHVGHQAVIGRAVRLARERGLASAVLTFDRHPMEVVAPQHVPRMLSTLPDKVRLIEEQGPDELLLLTFDAGMAALPAADFCARLLGDVLQARVVVVGENFNFGAGGAGDVGLLRDCGAAHGYEAIVEPLVTEHGKTISSTRIRRLLHDGELEEVREILGRPPSATGRVIPGDQRGRTLGVPTANIEVHAGTIFPGKGVYAARARVQGLWYRAAVNIGHNPTFVENAETAPISIEAHLLQFAGDIYDHDIHVDFLHKIRDERRFDSVDDLIAQMQDDIRRTAQLADPALVEVGLSS